MKIKGGVIVFVKFEERDSFRVVGVNVKTDMQNSSKDCPGSWEKFNPICVSEKELTSQSEYFGICHNYDTEKGTFDYMACAKIEKGFDNLDVKIVPAAKYAVFKITEGLSKIKETYDYIFNEWMPSSGYMYDPKGNDFELYDEDFIESHEAILYIYIPIVEVPKK